MKRVIWFLTFAAFSLGMERPAVGSLLGPQETSTIIQSAITDGDLAMLGVIYGIVTNQPLNYNSLATANSWNGNLTGLFMGTAVNFSYQGDLSDFPTGAITWTSTGAYGNAVLSGSGTARVTETPDGFTMSSTYDRTIGDFTINGTEEHTVEVTDANTFRDLSVFAGRVNGMFYVCAGSDTAQEFRDEFLSSFNGVCARTGKRIPVTVDDDYTKTFIGADIALSGTVQLVPEPVAEPSASLLLASGLAGLLGIGWWKRGYGSAPTSTGCRI
jgi:hypothetical protein